VKSYVFIPDLHDDFFIFHSVLLNRSNNNNYVKKIQYRKYLPAQSRNIYFLRHSKNILKSSYLILTFVSILNHL